MTLICAQARRQGRMVLIKKNTLTHSFIHDGTTFEVGQRCCSRTNGRRLSSGANRVRVKQVEKEERKGKRKKSELRKKQRDVAKELASEAERH